MADVSQSKQLLRKIALIIGYSFVNAFGAAAMLIVEQRPLDQRGQTMISVIGVGALLGAITLMCYKKTLLKISLVFRFALVFVSVSLMTLVMQGLLAALLFNFTSFAGQSLATADGLTEIFFGLIYGFAYYLAYGTALAWPAGLIAAFLFTLGFLTLRPQHDTTSLANRRTH